MPNIILNLRKPQKILLVVCVEAFLIVIVFILVRGYRTFYHVPAEKQAELEIEFKAIVPLKGANLVSYNANNRLFDSLVDAHYLTDIDSEEIFKYYDEQLKQHGWQLIGTKKVKIWDKDLGGKSAFYCKSEYVADLYYAGQDVPDELTYSLSLSWGMDECIQLRGDQNIITPASP